MIETEIFIRVNRKADLDIIQQRIIESSIQSPVYILEYESCYQIEFKSNDEEWELDSMILQSFQGYEYTKDLESGRKEIRIQISRYQSELSTDGWGRPLENPLNETKYLVKASAHKEAKFSPKIRVLFEDKEQNYFVNMVRGINRATDVKGFLLVDNFRSNDNCNAEVLKDKLYNSSLDAFHSGYSKICELAVSDFNGYLENKKKEIREWQKQPRKIIRDFINACNNSDEVGLLKHLDESIIFEKRKTWETIVRTDGISEFREYLTSPDQQLCGKAFKIKSSWKFNLPAVTIDVEYLPVSTVREGVHLKKYGSIRFVLQDNRIVNVIDES